MKTRILSFLIVVTFFISATGFAQTEKPGQRKQRSPEHKKMMMNRSEKQRGEYQKYFTEEQQESMKELRLETAKTVKPLKNELRELMAHQQTLTTSENADMKAINKNIDKMSDVKNEIAKIMAAQHQQVRSLLTEEQLIKFDTMKGKRGQKQNMNRGEYRQPGRGA